MKKIVRSVLLGFILLILLPSCNAKNEGNFAPGSSEGNNVVVQTNQKIIYTVDYSIVCENVNETIKKVNGQVSTINGYIANSSQTNSDYGWYTYKVPTSELNQFLDFVDALGGNSSKRISTQDVTSSYNELRAKIETLTASKAAYVNLLNQAQSVDEIISIQRSITSLDQEIKEAQLSLSHLENSIDYSTVTITYHLQGNEASEFWNEYGSFIVTIGKTFGAVILYSLPFAAVGGIIFGIIVLKKKKNKKS